jgi:hypothetical protein
MHTMKTKNIRHSLAVGLTMLALAANSTFAHDTVKGAGKLLELSRAATHRGAADSSVTHMNAVSARPTTRTDYLKGAAKLLELSGTRVVAGQNGQQNALLTSTPASTTKPPGIVKGAARLIELTRDSRSPQMHVAPLK